MPAGGASRQHGSGISADWARRISITLCTARSDVTVASIGVWMGWVGTISNWNTDRFKTVTTFVTIESYS